VSPPLSWLLRNWKLKILAVILALILLLAVAFSENPLSIRQYNALIRYSDLPAGQVLIRPPARAAITVSGLNSAVRTLNDSNAYVNVSLARLRVGPTQSVFAQPTVLVSGVNVQGGPIPLSLAVQELKEDTLNVEVRFPQPSPNYSVVADQTYPYCDNPAEPCKVTLRAPASYFADLVAYVEIPGALTGTTTEVPQVPVKFAQSGRSIDFASLDTLPKPRIEHALMPKVKVTAVSSATSKPVALRPRLTGVGQQACGFAIAGVTITKGDGVALVSGPTVDVGKSPDVIDLPPIDITGANGNVTKTLTVPLSDSKLLVDPARVNVTVVLQKQFDCVAPTPAPAPPTPTPTPTPRPSGSP
jgi:YbbR domain-containing protein